MKRELLDEYEDSDEAQYARIAKMGLRELLDYVLEHPYYLTDSYYKGFDKAIYSRAEALGK